LINKFSNTNTKQVNSLIQAGTNIMAAKGSKPGLNGDRLSKLKFTHFWKSESTVPPVPGRKAREADPKGFSHGVPQNHNMGTIISEIAWDGVRTLITRKTP
jgi:hypothetical protein